MWIEEISIEDFGKFHETTVFGKLNPGLVVFYGENEAGKTTLFHLIKTLLYGFSPSSIDQHPYASYQHERIEFTAKIHTHSGETGQVYRRLLSTPKATYTTESQAVSLKNQPLPVARHISPEIYHRIYALQVEELVGLEGKAWEQVQDKLLANYGSQLLRNTRQVLKELQEEMNGLYRAGARGKARSRELEQEIRTLKQEAQAARQRQETLWVYEEKLAALKKSLEETAAERTRLKLLARKIKRLLPLQRLLAEREALIAQLKHPQLFRQLPAQLVTKLDGLTDRLDKLKQEENRLNQQKQALTQALIRLTPEENRIMAQREELEVRHRQWLTLQARREEWERLEQEVLRLTEQARYEARNLLTGPLTPQRQEAILELNLPGLRVEIAQHQKTKDRLLELETLMVQQAHEAGSKPGLGALGGLILGLGLLVLGFLTSSWPLLAGAGLAFTVALADFLLGRSRRQQTQSRLKQQLGYDSLAQERDRLYQQSKEEKKRLTDSLGQIGIEPVQIENMEALFLTNLIRLRDLVFELEERKGRYEERLRDYQDQTDRLIRWLAGFGQVVNPEESLLHLRREGERLKEQLLDNQNREKQLQALEASLALFAEERTELESALQVYGDQLVQLGQGDQEAGRAVYLTNEGLAVRIALLEERLEALEEVQTLTAELEAFRQEHPQGFSPEAQEALELRQEVLEGTWQELKDQERELLSAKQALLDQPGADEISSRLAWLEAEREAVLFKRDRLLLLSEVLKQADEAFREENQPDVLKQAGAYLSQITGGRYTQIFLEEEGEERVVRLRQRGSAYPIPVGPSLSKGTLNQLFLALRLSLIDHLDQQGETLPICFDELLINFDQERLSAYLQLLKTIAARRQIFFFTCHQWLADQLEREFGIAAVRLTAGRSREALKEAAPRSLG